VFADHGPEGSGEPLAVMLRPGNAGSNTAADHIAATRAALAQLPAAVRRRVLIRTDSGGGTHGFLEWLARRRLQYSAWFTITDDIATSARTGQLADLELRHRRRARCEDRIRCAKDTGLRCLPLHGYDQNQIWCQIVALASEILAWTAMLALTGPARRWELKRLRLRLLSAAGRIVRGSRRPGCASPPGGHG
jgi:hypothetical protein